MLKDKIAVVTGGGQGLGKHAAKTLAENGVKIVIADVNMETAEQAATELSAHAETTAILLDVRNEGDVQKAFADVAQKLGGIDILVNNAAIVPHFRWGSTLWPPISDMPHDFWDSVIQTNLYGTFNCTKHAIPHMKNREGGHIINIWGGGGTRALAYMVTKNGIRTFTRYVAEEVRDDNICVVTFSPRFAIATETAPQEAKDRMPSPEVLGDGFVLSAQLPMVSSGQCFAHEDGKLILEAPMDG
ncbi:MAG: SDR family NAD(P)-dependent oxidoreductase [Alphaproteobacteria bacterium]|jgi:3-oxoacyl-[acyl-carrier protein] reductase